MLAATDSLTVRIRPNPLLSRAMNEPARAIVLNVSLASVLDVLTVADWRLAICRMREAVCAALVESVLPADFRSVIAVTLVAVSNLINAFDADRLTETTLSTVNRLPINFKNDTAGTIVLEMALFIDFDRAVDTVPTAWRTTLSAKDRINVLTTAALFKMFLPVALTLVAVALLEVFADLLMLLMFAGTLPVSIKTVLPAILDCVIDSVWASARNLPRLLTTCKDVDADTFKS